MGLIMASKINKRYTATITGVFNIEGDKIEIEVEDVENLINLAKFAIDFNGKEAKLSITYGEEIDG